MVDSKWRRQLEYFNRSVHGVGDIGADGTYTVGSRATTRTAVYVLHDDEVTVSLRVVPTKRNNK